MTIFHHRLIRQTDFAVKGTDEPLWKRSFGRVSLQVSRRAMVQDSLVTTIHTLSMELRIIESLLSYAC